MNDRIKKKKVCTKQSDIFTGKSNAGISTISKKLQWFVLFVVALWPFVYLHSLVFAINERFRSIGNDFRYYYKFKVYLLANLANFHFPLWSPSEAAGYPFALSPFAQAFYPLNIPLVIFYKLAGGYSWLDHQIYTVLSMAIFALGLFLWLRRLNDNLRAVFFATMVISISFKLTEILRFTTAAHTAAWYPWILYGLTRIILNRSVKDAVISAALLCFFLICFCTAGYPYYVYYSVFLFVPYLCVFLKKPLCVRLVGTGQIYWRRVVITLVIAGFIAGLICIPYLLGLRNLMAQTADRGGKNYEFSVSHQFSFEDTVGSLVYPPAAQSEGWYFFSITALLIIILHLLNVHVACKSREQIEQPPQKNSSLPYTSTLAKIFFLIWIGLISYITYGRQSYLFFFLWKYMPGFSALRVWGRLNIVLLPIIAWLLSQAYASFEMTISSAGANNKQLRKWMPLIIIAFVYSIVLSVQLYFYYGKIYDNYWLSFFKNVLSKEVSFLSYGAMAFGMLFLFLIISRFVPLRSTVGKRIVLVGLVMMSAIEMEPVGTHMWTFENQLLPQRVHINVEELNKASFSYRRIENNGMISLGPNFNAGIVQNWYFSRYITFLEKTKNEPAEQRFLLGIENGQKIFFSKSIDYLNISQFLEDVSSCKPSIKILSYNGDELTVEVHTSIAGYLSFIDNWDNGWKAFVDGQEVKIELLFGTFKSVAVKEGFHRIKFIYKPGLFIL